MTPLFHGWKSGHSSSSTLIQDKHSEPKTAGPGEEGPVCAFGHAGSIPQPAWAPRHQDSNFFSLQPPEMPGRR